MEEKWNLVSDGLPSVRGKYLVVRGHFYKSNSYEDKGVVTYDTALVMFNPKGIWPSMQPWFDTGFFYTHWMGPIAEKPDMKGFPILCNEDPCNNLPVKALVGSTPTRAPKISLYGA